MARIRADYVKGTTTTDPLLVGGTTLDSAGLANLPAVSGGDIAAVTLFDGTNYEIVHVTAHTAAATTATILRAQEGSTAREWPAGTAWYLGLTVDDTESFADAGHTHTGAAVRSINAQTGTSYTLVLGDAGNVITMTNAAASTLTVPPNSSVAFQVGTVIEGAQLGTGQVTITPGSGVTINATPGLKVAARYGSFALLKTATDVWLAMGRLAA